MSDSPRSWQSGHPVNTEVLTEALSPAFQLQQRASSRQTFDLLDDYDWNFWNRDWLLTRSEAGEYTLNTARETIHQKSRRQAPRFWWDFPEGRFQDALKKASSLRAILPVARLELETVELNLLNEDDKTVARCECVNTPQGSALVTLKPLRGYTDEFELAAAAITALGLTPNDQRLLKALAVQTGVTPKQKSASDYDLTQSLPAEIAVRRMTAQMVNAAREHEQGVIDDIDTEFLHHYRVSLRKARSLINLMKKVLPAADHLELKTRLAQLAGPTNTLRDLDVFLLNKDYYLGLLPEEYAGGLTLLFSHIKRERQRAYKSVATFFTSTAYSAHIQAVTTTLSGEAQLTSTAAAKPIGRVACTRIDKRYQTICALGASITPSTPDAEVHELRIECKKLRYLLEFFAELFDARVLSRLVKSLKALQTILGNFNDYSVQKAFLADHLQREKKPDTIAAINGLVAVLHQKQIQERQLISQAFIAFSDSGTASLVQQLCTEAAATEPKATQAPKTPGEQ